MKIKSRIGIFSMFVILSLAYLIIGCASEEESQAYTATCITTLAIGGTWNVSYKCESKNRDCFTGADTYQVTQDFTDDPTLVTAEIIDSDLPIDIGVTFEGDLCGMVFTFSATNLENDESGTWTFSDDQNFQKITTYEAGEYTCIGTGTKPPLPLPAPYFCP